MVVGATLITHCINDDASFLRESVILNIIYYKV